MGSNETNLSYITTLSFTVFSEQDTLYLAELLSQYLKEGDLVTLTGDLGSGKTVLARGLIRSLTGQPELAITSPTYLLIQDYRGISANIVHADLYRLASPEELIEIGFSELCEVAISIVEWPDRYPQLSTAARFQITINSLDNLNPFSRHITITAAQKDLTAFHSQYEMNRFLVEHNWENASRSLIAGDASGRRFERLIKGSNKSILMIAPPAVNDTQNDIAYRYRKTAKLATSLDALIAVTQALSDHGFSAPQLYGYDLEKGFVLSEDLGTVQIFDDNGPIIERYKTSVSFLDALHRSKIPEQIQIWDRLIYKLPKYDIDALLIEVELFLDWYVPNLTLRKVSDNALTEFMEIWKYLLTPLQEHSHGWTLRDFHSPNILWLNERCGVKKVGLIDIQDTVLGHPAYDLASLLQDARVLISEDLELELFQYYVQLRMKTDQNFDTGVFAEAYAIYALQRITKILGIFVRLNLRDMKPEYLKYLPNLISYARRNLCHSSLSQYRQWLSKNCPNIIFDDLTGEPSL